MEFLSDENIVLSYKRARKSRKNKQEVFLWDYNLESNLLNLREDLLT
jgi:hypothetical protein